MAQGNTVTIEHLPLKLINAFHDSINELRPRSAGHLIHIAIPTDSTLEEAQNIFLKYFLSQRYKLMGRRPSMAALARSLGVSRATIFRRLHDVGIRVGKGEVKSNVK
jgi:transcriptional regulator of acetoin/glycerol metabolism